MSVTGLALDASSRNPIVLLTDPAGLRQVPIWIDHAQAHNIVAGMENSNSQTPLSHDLMISLINAGNMQLDQVIIHTIEKNAFRAILKLKSLEKKSNNGIEQLLGLRIFPMYVLISIRSEY